MAFTQADLTALDTAIAGFKGAKSITFADGQTLQMSTVAEMLELRRFIQSQVDSTVSPTYRLAVTNKGT